MTRASVVVPTHDHALTLPLAVGSVLAQTVSDLEVIVVGDGVTPEVRATAEQLCRVDGRVVFLDLAKGPHHGELHRDLAVRSARSEAIFYLCDDDLLLPQHVENLLSLLVDADLVQCRNGYVDTAGELHLYPTDLADPEAIAWHLREPRRNATSLTGTAHTRGAYLALPIGWATTPVGEWPDHYMWKKFFRMPRFRGATHPELTAVQLSTSMGRESWDAARRLHELAWWRERLGEPDGPAWFQQEVARAATRELERLYRDWIDATMELGQVNATVARRVASVEQRNAALSSSVDDLTARLRETERHAADLAALPAALEASRSWRLTAPLRASAAWLRNR